MKPALLKRILSNNTKIIATLGPATLSRNMVRSLFLAGADVFRLNFSHGDRAFHMKAIQLIRELNAHYRSDVPLLMDIQGPKIRTGEMKEGALALKKGQVLKILPYEVKGSEDGISISYRNLYQCVRSGQRILLDDGLIRLAVLEVKRKTIFARAQNSAMLRSRKGVNLPGTRLDIPALTAKDRSDLLFGVKNGIDVIALSFVRSEEDIHQLRKYLRTLTPRPLTVIAKIEKPEALKRISRILDCSDGLMVARGDLGVEVSQEEVPLLQKQLIRAARENNRFVITATQMLESMKENPVPTRAEATDVFNAVLDGTDAGMLSAETSVGRYPVEAVRTMKRILNRAESHLKNIPYPVFRDLTKGPAELISRSAAELAQKTRSRTIMAFTNSGRTARMLSRLRPPARILAFTTHTSRVHQLHFYFGIFPFFIRRFATLKAMLKEGRSFLTNKGLAKKGDSVLVTLGIPAEQEPSTNALLIYRI